MKRAFFAGIAVLFALAVVTCDLFPSAEKGGNIVEYTEDGRLLVNLSISTGGAGRALTTDLAKGGVDYYEVAFQDLVTPTKIFRTSWDYTKAGKISVPAGNYNTAAKAILFAGRYEDKTLLAVGNLSAVDSTPGSTTITPSTTSVTFTLAALTNDVNKDAATTTFKITGPTSPAGQSYATPSSGDLPIVMLNNTAYPVFRIPANYTNVGTSGNNTRITAMYTITCPSNAGVMIADAGRVISAGYPYLENPGLTINGTITPDTGAVPTNGNFIIAIGDTAGIGKGLTRLSIEIPVNAIDTTNDYPGTWYIRGGMTQNILDQGSTANSLGGAVLLAVGADLSGITINIVP